MLSFERYEMCFYRRRWRSGGDDVGDRRQGLHHGGVLERIRDDDRQLPDEHACRRAGPGHGGRARRQHGLGLRRRNSRMSPLFKLQYSQPVF